MPPRIIGLVAEKNLQWCLGFKRSFGDDQGIFCDLGGLLKRHERVAEMDEDLSYQHHVMLFDAFGHAVDVAENKISARLQFSVRKSVSVAKPAEMGRSETLVAVDMLASFGPIAIKTCN